MLALLLLSISVNDHSDRARSLRVQNWEEWLIHQGLCCHSEGPHRLEKFSQEKCQVLNLGGSSPRQHWFVVGATQLGSSLVEKGLVDTKLNMSLPAPAIWWFCNSGHTFNEVVSHVPVLRKTIDFYLVHVYFFSELGLGNFKNYHRMRSEGNRMVSIMRPIPLL